MGSACGAPKVEPVAEASNANSAAAQPGAANSANAATEGADKATSLPNQDAKERRKKDPSQMSFKGMGSTKNLTLQENLATVHKAKDNIRTFYDLGENKKSGSSGKVLGTGMSGAVRKITRKVDGKSFALKTINLSNMDSQSIADLENEIDILKSLDHPHIAKLYETFYEEGMCIHMVLEICEGGELFDRLMKKHKFKEGDTARLLSQMLSAMRYLHAKSIVHRDLKLENWLFRANSGDEADNIVLIDFGLSHKHTKNEHMHSRVGTSYYIAPEVLNGDYTAACDMWSLGVITYMLLSGTAPFGGDNDDQILASVMKHTYKMTGSTWNKISKDAKDFVSKLLQVDIEHRATADEAVRHAWIVKEAAKHPQHELDATMFKNMRKFKEFHELKRVAIEIVAFSLSHDQIKDLEEVFEDMNVGGDGFVTFEELKGALHKKGLQDDDEIKQIFDAIDEEHTGKIHVTEFVAATLQEKYYQDEFYLHAAFHKLDDENKGYITFESVRDLLGKCTTDDRVDQILEDAKLTGHGPEHKISYKEFLQFMRTDGEKQMESHRSEMQKKASSKTNEEVPEPRKRSLSGGTAKMPHAAETDDEML